MLVGLQLLKGQTSVEGCIEELSDRARIGGLGRGAAPQSLLLAEPVGVLAAGGGAVSRAPALARRLEVPTAADTDHVALRIIFISS